MAAVWAAIIYFVNSVNGRRINFRRFKLYRHFILLVFPIEITQHANGGDENGDENSTHLFSLSTAKALRSQCAGDRRLTIFRANRSVKANSEASICL